VCCFLQYIMPESSSSGFAGHKDTDDTSSADSRVFGKRHHPSASDVPGSGSSSPGKRPRRDDQAPCGSKLDCMTCPKCKCCHHCGGKWATKTQWRDWRDLEMHFDGGSRPPKTGTRIPGLSGAGAIIWRYVSPSSKVIRAKFGVTFSFAAANQTSCEGKITCACSGSLLVLRFCCPCQHERHIL
jgi:hypothetical protein